MSRRTRATKLLSSVRARNKNGEGATLKFESQSTIRKPDPFTNLAEPRLADERVYTLGVPVLAYKTFVEDGETLAEGLPERATRKICPDNYPHDGIDM